MGPKEISVKARYCQDCMNNARRMQERLLHNGLTPAQNERLSRVSIHTEAAVEFARQAAVSSPLHGSDVVPLPDVSDSPQGISTLINEAVKTLPLITSQPESILGGSIRVAARDTERAAYEASHGIKTYLAETA